MKDKPSAPIGNQNASIHGYYSEILDKGESLRRAVQKTLSGSPFLDIENL